MKTPIINVAHLKRIAIFLTLSIGMLLDTSAIASQHPQENLLPAFPGAEGFGRYATGGRGGKVYHVTTLDDNMEPGSFRYAVMQQGPRTIVFDVAGTILLTSNLRIEEGHLTIAGQTAPSGGVCIARYPVTIHGENIIIRYLRFRVGNEGGGEPDGLAGSRFKNVIIDHCSISWSVDECCSLYGGEDLTVQWCLISESLVTAGHSKGSHGYGAIFGGTRASYHHNLLAHHQSRTPRLGPSPQTQENEIVDMRNNVIYNWAGNGCYGGEGMKVNIVNNYYKPGPATPKDRPIAYRIAALGVRTTRYCTNSKGHPNRWKPMEHVWGRFYVDGNFIEGYPEVSSDNWTKGIYAQIDTTACDGTFTDDVRRDIRLLSPLEAGVITTHSASEAYQLVLTHVGCSKVRDDLDVRIVDEVRNGTATYLGSVSSNAHLMPGLIDLPSDVKPIEQKEIWPSLTREDQKIAVVNDSDGDGIPDEWEVENGLNPLDVLDGSKISKEADGYTYLEVYLEKKG